MSRTQHGRRRHRAMAEIPAYRNPVAAAVARQRMKAAARDERIGALLMQQDEDATDLLAHLAWIIGLGAEIALQVHGSHHATLRRLHGALRSVAAMCLHHGYRWQASQAVALQEALAEAHQLISAEPAIATRYTRGADWLASVISRHQLPADAVAGAELYQPTTGAKPC